jgi:hypothetical protein
MGRAFVLTTGSKAGTAGGTFADSLTANSNDSLNVANFVNGGAHVLEMWGGDSDSVAEFQFIWTRPQSTHDQSHGMRVEVPSLALGGAATNAAFNFLPGFGRIELFKSDTLTAQATTTASDDILASWVTLYDDLPGAAGVFLDWPTIERHRLSTVGLFVGPTASGTAGAYGTNRLLNADESRLHANTWYAILGCSVQTQVSTIALTGPDWGGQRIGMPAGSLDLRSNTWFVDQWDKWSRTYGDNFACIPCFNSNNAGSINVAVADLEASTQPKIDFLMYELDIPNTQTPTPGI